MRIRKHLNLHPPPPPPPPESPPRQPSPSPPPPARRVVVADPGDGDIPAAAYPRWGFLTSTEQEVDKVEDEGYHTTSPGGESASLAAELLAMRYSIPPSSAGGRGEGYRTSLPPKKRKEGSIGGTSREFAGTSNHISVKEEMKSKTNKKCLLPNGYTKEAEFDEKNVSNNGSSGGGGSKKIRRGSELMEGSRCSRVNGRGWRCSQPTLVGYSLCEHHLGKGRLRSMNTARNRRMMAASSTDGGHQQKMGARVVEPEKDRLLTPIQKIQDDYKNMDSDDEEEERQMNLLMQKRMKVGAVKARSMSSLLGQMDDDNKEVAMPSNFGGEYGDRSTYHGM